jgi:hypothetical protein
MIMAKVDGAHGLCLGALISLVLASCGAGGQGSDGEHPQPLSSSASAEDRGTAAGEPSESGREFEVPEGPWEPGLYQAYAPSGAELAIELPASEPPADIEAYRLKIDASEVVYVSVDVDNRDGKQSVNMYEIDVYDTAGKEYTFSGVETLIGEWMDDVGVDTNEQIDLYNEGVDLSNKYMDDVAVSERATMVLYGTELPEQIADVQVWAEGAFENTFAVPVTE